MGGHILTKSMILQLETTEHAQMIDITSYVQQYVKANYIQSGIVVIHCPHTTAGIMVNECTDPDVVTDILRRLDEQYPWHHRLDLHLEGNTAAHMKAITTGASATIVISDGEMQLGIWQGIFFCEFDGPRTRKIHIKGIID